MDKDELITALTEKKFYGTIDRLEQGKITLDQAERELNGTMKPNVKILDFDEPLIFGKTWEEIQAMQKGEQ